MIYVSSNRIVIKTDKGDIGVNTNNDVVIGLTLNVNKYEKHNGNTWSCLPWDSPICAYDNNKYIEYYPSGHVCKKCGYNNDIGDYEYNHDLESELLYEEIEMNVISDELLLEKCKFSPKSRKRIEMLPLKIDTEKKILELHAKIMNDSCDEIIIIAYIRNLKLLEKYENDINEGNSEKYKCNIYYPTYNQNISII